MRINLNISKREIAIWCGSCTLSIAFVCAAWMFCIYETTPEAVARYGWSPEAEADHAEIAAAMPAFQIVDDDGNAVVSHNEQANVRLWHATLKVHGKHHPNIPQQDNDCTAFGAMHAVELLQDIAIANGEPIDWKPIAPHYIYGRSKNPDHAPPFRGEGCSGAYTAKCVMEGVLAANTPGLPSYSGAISRQWGKQGAPAKWVIEAKKFPVRQTSPCYSASEIRDSVCNLYPVTIASNVGFNRIVIRDGRRVGMMSGEWKHQMVIVGYDGSGREPYWYVLNSWGDAKHGAPLGDEPPGGFWIDEESCQAIANQRACFAYSSFAGFPAREFHFDLFSTIGEPRGVSPRTVRGLTPTGSPNLERPDHEVHSHPLSVADRGDGERAGHQPARIAAGRSSRALSF